MTNAWKLATLIIATGAGMAIGAGFRMDRELGIYTVGWLLVIVGLRTGVIVWGRSFKSLVKGSVGHGRDTDADGFAAGYLEGRLVAGGGWHLIGGRTLTRIPHLYADLQDGPYRVIAPGAPRPRYCILSPLVEDLDK